MKYATAVSFRQALEDRIRTNTPRHQIPRLRKMIAFERLMARLDEQWILKGGYALQLRTNKARTTQDVDLLVQQLVPDQINQYLLEQVHQDMGDYFEFYIERVDQPVEAGAAFRFRVSVRLAGRVFERFHVDVGIGDPIIEPLEYLLPPQYLAFADLTTSPIPCYPITQQIAEKYHAFTQPHASGRSSRVKDYVDMLLLAEMEELDSLSLRQAIQATFDDRNTHEIPVRVPPPPKNWSPPYQRMAEEMGLAYASLPDAEEALQQFLDPILVGDIEKRWEPKHWRWR